MQTMNLVILTGNVGAKPEIKNFPDGGQKAIISLATNTGLGENQKTQWHKIHITGPEKVRVVEKLDKGDVLQIQGCIMYRSWSDNNGVNRTAVEIHAHWFSVMPKQLPQQQGQRQGQYQKSAPVQTPQQPDYPDDHFYGEPDFDSYVPQEEYYQDAAPQPQQAAQPRQNGNNRPQQQTAAPRQNNAAPARQTAAPRPAAPAKTNGGYQQQGGMKFSYNIGG